MVLKYPQEVQAGNDFVLFSHQEYRTNSAIVGSDVSGTAPASGEQIILYMPNSTPGISNQNSWKDHKYEGPLGEIMRNLGVGVAGGVNSVMGGGGASVEAALDQFQKQVDAVKAKGMGAGQQFIVGQIAEAFGLGGSGALTQLQRGEVYNPNVELLYEAPQLRSFSLDFIFIPKNIVEAQTVNRIIKEFKLWSSPEDNGTMLKVPHLWNVSYKSGVGAEGFMGKFKKCALTNVVVQHNPQTDMHVTFSDGTPVVTALSLAFQETDIITRKDHEEGGPQGM